MSINKGNLRQNTFTKMKYSTILQWKVGNMSHLYQFAGIRQEAIHFRFRFFPIMCFKQAAEDEPERYRHPFILRNLLHFCFCFYFKIDRI